jgi:hypothetical protein
MDRRITYSVTVEAKSGWERAYEGAEQIAQERALEGLAPALEALADARRASGVEVPSGT